MLSIITLRQYTPYFIFENTTTIDSIIQDTISAILEELQISSTHINKIIFAFIQLYIQQEFPLGFITTEIPAPFERYIDKIKYTPLLYHLIIIFIYHKIWIPSRQIIYLYIFPLSEL